MSHKPPAAGSGTTAVPIFARGIPILHLAKFICVTGIPISDHARLISHLA